MSPPTIDLSGKVALVTGGSRGIGRAVCEALGAAGARVAVNYARDREAAKATVAAIRSAGPDAAAFAADISNPEPARRLVGDVVTRWGRLDIVVGNAGVWEEDVGGTGSLAVWDKTFAVNVRGAYLVVDAAVPHLLKTRGSIVLVSSTAGQRGESRHSAYAASKGALISYTKSLAAELGPRGVRVNCVAPGWVATDMTAQTLADPSGRKEIERSIPLGHVAEPKEIAGPILFLISELASFVQGEVLNVNGGSVLVG